MSFYDVIPYSPDVFIKSRQPLLAYETESTCKYYNEETENDDC